MDPEIIQGGLMQNLGMDEGTAYRYAAEISASPELYGDVLAKIGLSDGFQAGFRAANDPRAVVNRSNMTLADWRIAGDALVGALRETFNPMTDTLGMGDTGMAAASTSMRPTEDIPMPNLGRFILGGIADPVGIGEDIASTAADPSLANLGLTALGMLPFVPAGMTRYEKVGSNIAKRLEDIPSAEEIAGKGKRIAGSGTTAIKSQQPTALQSSYSRGVVDEELVPPVQVNIEDLEGSTLHGIVGDTSGRHTVEQVNDVVFTNPIPTQGGFQYIDRPGSGYAGAASPTSSKLNEAFRSKDPVYVSVLMGESSSDFAVPTSRIFGEMLRHAPISKKDVPKIDEQIRKIGMSVKKKEIVNGEEVIYSETIYPFADFKSIGRPGYFDEYVEQLPTGSLRAALLKGLDKANLQKMGLPKVSDARLAMADEAQIGMDWGTTGYRTFVPDVNRGILKTTPEQSLTYAAGVDKVGPSGTLIGEGRGIPYALMFPDVSSELRKKGSGGGLPMTSPAYKVFEGSPKRAQQLVTPKVVDLVSSFREIEDRYGRRSAMQFAADTLKDVNVTKAMIDAARRAHAPKWMIAAMATAAGVSAAQEGERAESPDGT